MRGEETGKKWLLNLSYKKKITHNNESETNNQVKNKDLRGCVGVPDVVYVGVRGLLDGTGFLLLPHRSWVLNIDHRAWLAETC